MNLNTHLKGRIFSVDGTSYLVLSEASRRPEWLRVKALNARRTIIDMPVEEIERYLGAGVRLTPAS